MRKQAKLAIDPRFRGDDGEGEQSPPDLCIGFVGLKVPDFNAPFMPTVEIGWRLAFDQWGQGYATEAATRVLAYGFNELALNEIVSFTVPANMASRRVMEKIGLHHNPKDDFHHPKLTCDHPLSQHVLYRLSRKDYLTQCANAKNKKTY